MSGGQEQIKRTGDCQRSPLSFCVWGKQSVGGGKRPMGEKSARPVREVPAGEAAACRRSRRLPEKPPPIGETPGAVRKERRKTAYFQKNFIKIQKLAYNGKTRHYAGKKSKKDKKRDTVHGRLILWHDDKKREVVVS